MSYLGETPITYLRDLNNDGYIDEITLSLNISDDEPVPSISISYGSASGFVAGPVLSPPYGVNSISFADLNGNGNLEIVCTSNYFDQFRYITEFNNASVTIFYPKDSHSYYDPYIIPVGNGSNWPVGVAFSTPNSAGNENIVVQLNDGTSTVLYNEGGGNFAACFVTGTMIAVPGGAHPVEALVAGDRVVCLFGGTALIKWIGHRAVNCRRHPHPRDILPVRVAADAFGPGLPRRSLELSPDHAVFVDDVLVPIRFLQNGQTIAQIQVPNVSYWHVELDRHDVLFAENLPCESFLDVGNRAAFENAGKTIHMHPDFAVRAWDGDACAPLVVAGLQLERVRARLNERLLAVPALEGRSVNRSR